MSERELRRNIRLNWERATRREPVKPARTLDELNGQHEENQSNLHELWMNLN